MSNVLRWLDAASDTRSDAPACIPLGIYELQYVRYHEAQRFKSVFDYTYSRLRWWQLEQHREAEQKGKIKTVGDRVVFFQNSAKCYTDSRNYPIQAAAAVTFSFSPYNGFTPGW